MGNLNWVTTRKNLFIRTLLDIFIIIVIFYKSSVTSIFLITFFWILVSYILGRYSFIIDKKTNESSYLKWFKFNLKNLIFLLIVIFLGIQIFHLFQYREFIKIIDSYIFNNFMKASVFSFSLQLIYFTYSLINKKINKKILLIGEDSDKDQLSQYLKYFAEDIITSKNINEIFNHLSKLKEIIILNNYTFEKNTVLLEEIIKLKIPIYKPIEWIEENFKVLPVENVNEDDLYHIKWKSERNSLQQRIKRIGDISFSIVLLLPSTIILLISAILIKLEDGGPIFFKQTRTGLWGKKFQLYKLRTMNIYAEENGVQWAKKNDKRITNIGKILRMLRIDELPQLIQVIKGEMSLIGPRPERPEFDQIIQSKIKYYNMRNWIKPGLSGWAQVNISYGSSIEDSKNKLYYDLYYLKNFSFLFDLIIFIKTLKLVLSAKGSQPDN